MTKRKKEREKRKKGECQIWKVNETNRKEIWNEAKRLKLVEVVFLLKEITNVHCSK